jgi:prepilin-type N-terminal cleavage/methylation domain-containing protein
MKVVMQAKPANRPAVRAAFTLTEVLVTMAIMGLVFAGILTGNNATSNRAEWSGYSLAAQAQAVQQLEQFHAATWDTQAQPPVDWTTNFPASNTNVLDLPIASTNAIWVTNYVAISNLTISSNPPVYLKMMRVDTVWLWRSKTLFTNTLVTYRAPDQ